MKVRCVGGPIGGTEQELNDGIQWNSVEWRVFKTVPPNTVLALTEGGGMAVPTVCRYEYRLEKYPDGQVFAYWSGR